MSKISTKTKSLVFVIILMSVLFVSQMYQNSIFYKTYIEQIRLSYSKTFEDFYKSFIDREFDKYSSLATHFSRKENILNLKNSDNLSIMRDINFYYLHFKSRDKFLKDIYFIDKNLRFKVGKNSINYGNDALSRYKIYKEKINYEKNKIFDSKVSDKKLDLILLFGVFENSEFIGFIEVVLSAQTLLENLNFFDGSIGHILIGSDFINFNGEKIKIDPNKNHITIRDKVYIAKQYEIKNVSDQKVANSIFLLDITDKEKFYNNSISKNIVFGLFFFAISVLILNFIFTFLITKLENTNLMLNHKIKEAIEKERQKDKLLIYQSKLVGTGEMIANIAHQWRQPLTELSSINMLLEALYEKNRLTKENLYANIKNSSEIIAYMSRTIDDFRNFYKPDKEKEIFSVKDAVLSSFSIIRSSLEAHDIDCKIVSEDDNIKIYGYKSEFSQAVLNILSNSKDALLNVSDRQRAILITIKRDKKLVSISLQDNGGGIDNTIIGNIFDPYFTTKHSFQGTGIGLYMTKMIIEDNMGGKIYVSNQELNGKIGTVLEIRFENLKA